ncbi:MAG: hypothetical protein ACRDVW_12200 [Acidimicrobiales bacterium]
MPLPGSAMMNVAQTPSAKVKPRIVQRLVPTPESTSAVIVTAKPGNPATISL